MTQKLALISAVLGALFIVATTIAGGAAFPDYSHASQFISELGARGAPNAQIVNLAGFLPAGICVSAFAFFAWRTLPRSKATTLGMLGIALFALGYLAAAFFPCEARCRPAEPSLSQAIHNLLGLAGYFTAPATLFVLGWQARRWPKAAHLSVLGLLGGILALLGLLFLSPEFKYVGIAQRVLEGSMLTWIVACALYVHRPSPENLRRHAN